MNTTKSPGTRNSIIILFISAALFFLACIIFRVAPDRLIGAAFCHQIDDRSPAYGFPFCYRCSGLFMGIGFGIIYSFFHIRSEKKISVFRISVFFAAFITYLLDIINKLDFIPVHFYTDRPETRLLSSFPMGYMLSLLMLSIFQLLIPSNKSNTGENIIRQIVYFVLCLVFTFLVFFRDIHILIEFARIFICLASILFLCVLYQILINCIDFLKDQTHNKTAVTVFSAALALFQIITLGSLHILLLRSILVNQ